jgi:hypothetical protein
MTAARHTVIFVSPGIITTVPSIPARFEWEVLIVYEPASGRVSIEKEEETPVVLGFLTTELEEEIARRMIKAKLTFI